MSRTWVFCVLAAMLVAVFSISPHQGLNSTCINDHCYVSASASLLALIASPIMTAFVIFYPQEATTGVRVEPVKIWERFVAFVIDFLVVVSTASPIAALPILLAEARATGHFQWSFERDFLRPSDLALVFPAVLSMFVALFAYFYIHPVIGRQTVGQYLLGLRVEGVPGTGRKPAFALNVLLGYIGLCAWPISVYLAAKRQDKAFWWNLRTRTRVIRVV